MTLFAADKLSKLRELRHETESDDERNLAVRHMRVRRLRHYQRSLAMLEERLPDHPLVGELRDELAEFIPHPPIPARAH